MKTFVVLLVEQLTFGYSYAVKQNIFDGLGECAPNKTGAVLVDFRLRPHVYADTDSGISDDYLLARVLPQPVLLNGTLLTFPVLGLYICKYGECGTI